MHFQNKNHRKVRKHRQGTHDLGQHFMHNRQLLDKLVTLARLNKDDTVLDIGAGKGALTLPLSRRAGRVLAIEIDPSLAAKLQKKIGAKGNIKLVNTDFLTMRLPDQPFCVVSNIPYAITTPLLDKLLHPQRSAMQRAVIVMEKGAAKRFTANPITDPRILTWRMWFHLELGMSIAPCHFSPPPAVESVALLIQRKKGCGISCRLHQRFYALVAHALRHPDLPVSVALRDVFTAPQIKRLLRGIDADRHKPICLMNETHWEHIFLTMVEHVKHSRWPVLSGAGRRRKRRKRK